VAHPIRPLHTKILKGNPMSAVIFKTVNAVFEFDQKEVKELIVQKKSEYDLDEVTKLLEAISADNIETNIIPEEPVYFDYIALDLIAVGKGSALCKTCNNTYLAGQLKPIKVGYGGSPFDIKREKKGVIKRLFAKKRKPPTMCGGKGYECPVGHHLISVIIWKTF
jgi:hypothetical protein